MGFAVEYTELMIPKFLLHVFLLLGHIRRFITWFFNVIGLGDLLVHTSFSSYTPNNTSDQTTSYSMDCRLAPSKKPLKYEGGEGEKEEEEEEDSCAVCLHEFSTTSGDDHHQVRQLTNCRHVFHKCCLDSWVELDQRTCPLCRTSLVPEDIDRKLQDIDAGGGGGGGTDLGVLSSSSCFDYDDYYVYDDDSFGFMMPSQVGN